MVFVRISSTEMPSRVPSLYLRSICMKLNGLAVVVVLVVVGGSVEDENACTVLRFERAGIITRGGAAKKIYHSLNF